MDAFGASVSRGAALARFGIALAVRISLVFGLFAATAPALGWLLGERFLDAASAVDHWIAFFLLTAVGAKMIRDALRGTDSAPVAVGIRFTVIVVSAFATSVDSAVFGVTLPALQIGLMTASATIGIAAFVAAFAGLYVGRVTGDVAGRRAEIAGGILLIGIACKILADHTL